MRFLNVLVVGPSATFQLISPFLISPELIFLAVRREDCLVKKCDDKKGQFFDLRCAGCGVDLDSCFFGCSAGSWQI